MRACTLEAPRIIPDGQRRRLTSEGVAKCGTTICRTMTKFRLPIQVCVFLFRAQADGREYLLLHRVPKLGSFWQGVTGAPEEGETLLQGAAREVLEETGLSPARIDPIDFTYRFPVIEEWREAYGPEPDEVVEHVFVAQVEDDEPALSWEHDAMKWCEPDEAAGMLKWPNNIEALSRCEEFLSAALM